MNKIFSMDLLGKKLTIKTGDVAQFANGAARVIYGDTVVDSFATAAKVTKEGMDFFPLGVDYEERAYSNGKIPSGFGKREGKPSDFEILTSRLIDRPIRPLFPTDFKNEVNINNIVKAQEPDCSPRVAAIIGTSVALSVSDIPFNGVVAGVEVGLIKGELIVNPTKKQKEISDMDLFVVGTKDKITTIEAKANEVSEDILEKAIIKAHDEIKKVVAFIENIKREVGKPKFDYNHSVIPKEMYNEVKSLFRDKMKKALLTTDKDQREESVKELTQQCKTELGPKYSNQKALLDAAITKLEKMVIRKLILNEDTRIDGRKLDQIRPLSAEVSTLPRVHGSGMFQRGQTQVETIVTLAPLEDTRHESNFMHHYNFPSFATGEMKPNRGPGRREIGHGYLGQKALEPVMPSKKDFPYFVRAVSEVLMSNGSSSQASICASTLALMDAGVPIKNPVAGIAAGLITDKKNPERYKTILDLQGIEDCFGDMDFKVAGTKKGITAIQMDTKIDGLTHEIIQKAFDLTKKGREQIIDQVILKTIDAPRKEVSKYAPKVYRPQNDIKIEAGQFYTGKVKNITKFGAFVEIQPGIEGLIHISNLDTKRVERVEDIVKIGDSVRVKVLGVDDRGKISLSRKDALPQFEKDNSTKIQKQMIDNSKKSWDSIIDKITDKPDKSSNAMNIEYVM